VALGDVLAVWSDDGARALLLTVGSTSLEAGAYKLQLQRLLDTGLYAPQLRRSGSTLPEIASLHFSLQ
jgi:hypothetical protein